MNLKFYFSVSILWSLENVLTSYYNYTELKLYLVEVVKHIIYHDQIQEKSDSWDNLNTTDDSTNLLNKSFEENINDLNITHQLFSYILFSINNRYTKFLKVYNSYITIMISECENYYNNKLFNKFIECTKLIHGVVFDSNGMFQTLYDNLTFINSLELNTIDSEYVTPYTIINEIRYVYNYTSLKTKCKFKNNIHKRMFMYTKLNGDFDTENACKDLLNIKQFHTTVNNMLSNLPLLDTNSHITSNFIHKYLLEKYNEKFILQQEIDKCFMNFIYDHHMTFCKETIKNENEKFGFQELLNQTLPGVEIKYNVHP
ncbi:uncharacterized protein LOC126900028 isoform X2 [Daktulosphaira vitifoliae]|uniref:uncharacterized protein LOC126900028 isoform X2 n=2 Tax=Daktulosphaira vitifoliae TaxID=58002 RepID=UPI0021AA4875|nr:uncharacterized protein LOC126900028 isoform X2 [Daktulosphaira vitifoliae]